MVDFFCLQKNHQRERMVIKIKITKQELQFEESLKQRLEFICEFSKVTPVFINGILASVVKEKKLDEKDE